MLTSLDFFYPLHDNPFTQGQITVCNVLSDVYASGVINIDHFLVVLSLSTEMSRSQREKVAVGIMKGMESKLEEAGTVIGGGQTVFNPWVTTGGSVTAFFDEQQEGFELFSNREAVPGDVLVLTKPLGTQMVINFSGYLRKSGKYNSLKKGEDFECINSQRIDAIRDSFSFFNEDFIRKFTERGYESMADLNLYASQCMRNQMKLGRVRACTDVTGFGIKGHAENLARIQSRKVNFILDKFVTFENLDKVDSVKDSRARDFKLMEGYTPESSGGLLIVMSAQGASDFVSDFKEKFNRDAWVIGRVVEGDRNVVFNENGLEVEYA